MARRRAGARGRALTMLTRRAATAVLLGSAGSLLMTKPGEAAARTRIVPFRTAPFPYEGIVPKSGEPFYDTTQDGERGHTTPRGGVYLESETYSDRSVLLAIPPRLVPSRGVIVVYLHGNEAKLDRDVVRRQRVVAQLMASRLDAALIAPQFAVDALDSSAGHFWDPGGFARFMDEAATRLAGMSGHRADDFAAMPIVLVAYSGGYNPLAAILKHGGVGERVAGLVLFDAVYGEEATFADWVLRYHDRSFFFSAYSASSASGNIALQAELETRGITIYDGLPPSLGPGIVGFLPAGDVPHNDFVTQAWVADPLRAVLARVQT